MNHTEVQTDAAETMIGERLQTSSEGKGKGATEWM